MTRYSPRIQPMSFLDKIFGSGGEGDGTRQLLDWLEGTLKRELKLDTIERDEDGDFPIAAGAL